MDQGLPISTERTGVIWFLLSEVEVGIVEYGTLHLLSWEGLHCLGPLYWE